MFFKKLVVFLAVLSLNACQLFAEEESATDKFIKELESLPDPVYITDYEACIQFFNAIAPVVAKCEGFDLIDNYEEILEEDCVAMQCNNTEKTSTNIDLDDCIEYYSTCAGQVEDDAPITCYGIMTTCVDTATDTDFATDSDTE